MAATTLPDIPPHKQSARNANFKLIEAEFGDGYEQVARDGINHDRETWDLVWNTEDKADVVTLTDFFDARGGDEPFFWKAPTDVSPKLWRVRGYKEDPQSTVASTLRATFKRWFGGEP